MLLLHQTIWCSLLIFWGFWQSNIHHSLDIECSWTRVSLGMGLLSVCITVQRNVYLYLWMRRPLTRLDNVIAQLRVKQLRWISTPTATVSIYVIYVIYVNVNAKVMSQIYRFSCGHITSRISHFKLTPDQYILLLHDPFTHAHAQSTAN